MSRLSYPSDLSDPAWSGVRPHIVPARLRGRPCPEQRWREYLDAILSVVRTGCPWRALPHDFGVHWSSAHKHFLRWARRGLWQRILDDLREQVRQDVGRASSPTAGGADSCSVKSTPAAGPRGFDGAKKLNGVKRHVVVDTLGLLLGVSVTAANTQDRAALPHLLAEVTTRCPTLELLWADRGYPGAPLAAAVAALSVTLALVSGVKPPAGSGQFAVQPRRWVVERSFAWMSRCRRLARQYEQTALAHEAMTIVSQIALMLRRLDKLTEPP